MDKRCNVVWSWSHTNEAYAAVRDNIAAKPREWLEICYAEWKAVGGAGLFHPRKPEHDGFDDRRYERALASAKHLCETELAVRIYDWAERSSTCSNGGFEAWCCPSGCHEAYFGRESFDCDKCGEHIERETRDAEHDAGLCETCAAAFKAAATVGVKVRIMQRQHGRGDVLLGEGVIEELVSGSVFIEGDGSRWRRKDGYSRNDFNHGLYSCRQRLVLVE